MDFNSIYYYFGLYLHAILETLQWLIIARAFLSFILPYDNPIVSFIHLLTEPIYRPIRNIKPQGGMLDFTPIVALLFLQALDRLIIL